MEKIFSSFPSANKLNDLDGESAVKLELMKLPGAKCNVSCHYQVSLLSGPICWLSSVMPNVVRKRLQYCMSCHQTGLHFLWVWVHLYVKGMGQGVTYFQCYCLQSVFTGNTSLCWSKKHSSSSFMGSLNHHTQLGVENCLLSICPTVVFFGLRGLPTWRSVYLFSVQQQQCYYREATCSKKKMNTMWGIVGALTTICAFRLELNIFKERNPWTFFIC